MASSRDLVLVAGVGVLTWWVIRRLQGRTVLGCRSRWEIVATSQGRAWRCVDPDTGQTTTLPYEEPPAEALDVARLALATWGDDDTAAVMTAVAGAESGWQAAIAGDPDPEDPWACAGYTSWGLWQIHMPTWHDALHAALGAPSSPCELAVWLQDPENNAKAARLVHERQGLRAWSAWNDGRWRLYWPQAATAVLQLRLSLP